jgi:hypothetical protein
MGARGKMVRAGAQNDAHKSAPNHNGFDLILASSDMITKNFPNFTTMPSFVFVIRNLFCYLKMRNKMARSV